MRSFNCNRKYAIESAHCIGGDFFANKFNELQERDAKNTKVDHYLTNVSIQRCVNLVRTEFF